MISRPAKTVNAVLSRPTAGLTPHALAGRVRGRRSLEDTLRDRIVMVTGASSGIGEAAALQIGEAGGTVLLVARTEEKLCTVADQIEALGGTAHVHPCDLADMEAVDRLIAAVLAEHGRVDILVNNAGRSIRRSLAASYDRPHDFERTMQLNYFAPVRLMLGLLPGMRERGKGQVINISTAGVQTRVPRFGAYIASKAALDTLSDAFQAETEDEGIRFTTIHMPLVRTPMIAPTKMYDRFPALSPKQAGAVIANAIVSRPRRISPLFGRVASFADSVSPEAMDQVRNRGFKMFDDPETVDTPRGEAFVEATAAFTGSRRRHATGLAAFPARH